MYKWNNFQSAYGDWHAKKSLAAGLSSVMLVVACGGSSDEPGNNIEPPINLDMPRVVDPAPDLSVAGEYGCEGCPDTDLSFETLMTESSAQSFVGLVDNAVGDGQWYIEASDGRAVGGTIDTDVSGNFVLETPLFCGTQIVKCVWSNETGSYTLVTEVVREQCTVSDIQLTLNWDDIGQDFELHLIKPDGKINDTVEGSDCTWTTCVTEQPDWGVVGNAADNPIKDVDDTNTAGPENIRLYQPENGTYSVFVEHWGTGQPEADGNVVLNVSGKDTLVSEVTDLPSRHVWYVGDITWPEKDIALDGRIIDCSNDWSAGCLLDLPSNIPPELVQP